MAHWQNGDELVLASGRTLYAHAGIIGIADNGAFSGGYDQMLDDDDDPLTSEERVELGDYMIALWTRFKEE